MYSTNSVQIQYRRKIYERVASFAYSNTDKKQLKWLPDSVVSAFNEMDFASEFASDLDYAAEACCAAFNMEPRNYAQVLSEAPDSYEAIIDRDRINHQPNICVLKSVCHKCARILGPDRPCARACQNNAIELDAMGRTRINWDKCQSCGKCMMACPYGAIIDKSSIFQVIHEMKQGREMDVILCPGLHGQFVETFGENALTEAFKLLGFDDIYELSGKGFGQGDDCICDVWRSANGKKHSICEIANYDTISDEIREAVKILKENSPNSNVVLVTACATSKVKFENKHSAQVDYVLDFEELMGMIEARGLSRDVIRGKEEEPLKYIC